MSRRARVLLVALVACAASALGWWFGEQRRAADTPYRVVDVLDGDTIVVRRDGGDDETIRMLGVDTPETHHPTQPVECFGPEASAFTSRHLFGRVVTLEADVEARDVYDRRLAYVYVDGDRFNDVLLRRGFARLLVIEPNRAHARTMLDAELAAEQHGRGLWDACAPQT
jgi:micrococcal nuclease